LRRSQPYNALLPCCIQAVDLLLLCFELLTDFGQLVLVGPELLGGGLTLSRRHFLS
jgi:hypothetical protein